MRALLKQEIAFFEKQDVAQLPSSISDNFVVIQQSIGEKVSNFIYCLAAVISGLVIGFVRAPLFAIICFAYFPILFLVLMLMGGIVKKAAISKIMVLKKLGGLMEETLSAAKLVISFANEDKEIKKFEN